MAQKKKGGNRERRRRKFATKQVWKLIGTWLKLDWNSAAHSFWVSFSGYPFFLAARGLQLRRTAAHVTVTRGFEAAAHRKE
jgi:hypothetical protein